MAKPKFVLYRDVFGSQVMSSKQMADALRAETSQLQASLGGSVTSVERPVKRGGTRLRLRVHTDMGTREALLVAQRAMNGVQP